MLCLYCAAYGHIIKALGLTTHLFQIALIAEYNTGTVASWKSDQEAGSVALSICDHPVAVHPATITTCFGSAGRI